MDDIYTFHIDAYSPETIPMARLGEYLSALASMMGEKSSVHFKGLEPGSTQLLTVVESEAVPKVRSNIGSVRIDGTDEFSNGYKRVNELLYGDNAAGKLLRHQTNVLAFPGRHLLRQPKLGPFKQDVAIDGILIRIGGKDRTAHATLLDDAGTTWNFEVLRDLAKTLATHLFGKPLRLHGSGRWIRNEDGAWHPDLLKATHFEELNDDKLSVVVDRIRALPSNAWREGVDPVAFTILRQYGHSEEA